MRQLEMGPERVLVTGSRFWTNRVVVERALIEETIAACRRGGLVLRGNNYQEYVRRAAKGAAYVAFVLGDCPDGADRFAVEWCRDNAMAHELFEVEGERTPERLRRRSKSMVLVGKPSRFVSFWDGRGANDDEASGTLYTMSVCVRAGVSGRVVAP